MFSALMPFTLTYHKRFSEREKCDREPDFELADLPISSSGSTRALGLAAVRFGAQAGRPFPAQQLKGLLRLDALR